MKTYMHILTFLLSALLFYGCDSTEPDKDKHPNITWKIYNIEASLLSSVIRDLVVIDKDNIWMIGEFHTPETGQYDSLGVWHDPYNLARWDGEKWNLETIYFEEQDARYYGYWQTIWAFNKDDVWLGFSSAYVHWDGKKYTSHKVPNVQGPESRIWGNSSQEIFIADDAGKILDINGNILAILNGKSISSIGGYNNNLFIGYTHRFDGKNSIYLISNTIIKNLNWDSTSSHYNIWADASGVLYVTNGELFKYENSIWNKINIGNESRIIDLEGTSQSDIYITGNNNLLGHFNGTSWYYYNMGIVESITFTKLSIRDNIITIAGRSTDGLIVIIGYK